MIKVKGTSCYPPVLIGILNGIAEVESFQIEVNHDSLGNDAVTIYINAAGNLDEKYIADIFRSRVRFAPQIVRLNADEIHKRVFPDNSRKAILFKDLRKES